VSIMSYIVEEIVGKDVNLMGDEYVRVKWAGYPSSCNSWILKSSIVEGEVRRVFSSRVR